MPKSRQLHKKYVIYSAKLKVWFSCLY